jgi:prepilin-type N-terminal cleavage/methylation domain-containing protein
MKLKKARGFSLIELVIVLSILVVIVGLGNMNLRVFHSNIINSTNVDYFNNKILHMISESALYCRWQNKSGYLLFSDDEKIVKFYCSNKRIRDYEVPKGFKFINTAHFNKRIEIDNLGAVITACTINYNDKKGDTHIITIRVATRYVQIKES